MDHMNHFKEEHPDDVGCCDSKIGIYYDIDLENDITDVELEIKVTEAGVIFEEEVTD